MTVWDVKLADDFLAGEQLYQRAVLRVLTGSSFAQDARIASFNTGSGAFLSLLASATTVVSGAAYEIHRILPPAEKDLILTDIAESLRFRSEVAIDSVRDLHSYSLSDAYIDVLGVRAYGWPTASKGEVPIHWWRIDPTATGRTLVIQPALEQSSQLILQVITSGSLGSADTATINLPSDSWLLSGAAARAYWLLEAGAPATETSAYKANRRELSARFARLSARYMPRITRDVQLEGWN